MKDEKIKAIMHTLSKFNYQRDVIDVFRDCIEFLALQVALKTDPQIKKENYEIFLHIFDSYDEEQKQIANKLCDEIKDLLLEFQDKFDDYLGELYMKIINEYGKPKLCQFFTPYHLSHLMAEITVDEQLQHNKICKINDCCCGAGGLCIATLEVLNDKKVNYLQNALIIANDIDKTCVYMTYLQLSFAGAAAIVSHQDTISQECWDSFKTLGYYIQKMQQQDQMA